MIGGYIFSPKFFTFVVDNWRGHLFKLYKSRSNLDTGKFAFLNGVCDCWNRLLEDIVTASSFNVFKNELDCHLRINWGLK